MHGAEGDLITDAEASDQEQQCTQQCTQQQTIVCTEACEQELVHSSKQALL